MDNNEKEIEEFLKKLPIGTKFKYRNYLYHVLGIFDDYNVAVKYYGKHKQWWHYKFFGAWTLWYSYEHDEIEIK